MSLLWTLIHRDIPSHLVFGTIRTYTIPIIPLVVAISYMPSFFRISLGMAFLFTMKSIVLAMIKFLVMYQIPL